jgi:glycosyltransferase involved in cell wall biosynthesis
MGSDVFQDGLVLRFITILFSKYIWQKTIVKSKQMSFIIKKSSLIPNGVDLNNFRPIEKKEAINKTKLNPHKFNIIFVAENPKLKVKNYKLAEDTIRLLNNPGVELSVVSGIKHEELVYYYNAADLLLMTSLSEGSPNVIKEAMACNCPIISTDVGDVKEVIKDVHNCFIVNNNPNMIADKINYLLSNRNHTNGRALISKLDSSAIAKKIIELYISILPFKKSITELKVLVVCSGTADNFVFDIHQAFVSDQMKAVSSKYNVVYDLFLIKTKGILGYLKSIKELRTKLLSNNYQLIHSHYGLSGFVSVFQRKIKKVVTFHGTDINDFTSRLISLFVHLRSDYSIFVSKKLLKRFKLFAKNSEVIPCGVNVDTFIPLDKIESRKKLGLDLNRKYILFTSSFDNKVKNYPLAKESVELANEDISLLELKNRTRSEVNLLLNAVDLLLMTSFSEGSPQTVKEALACNCPVISTPVGDVEKNIMGVNNCKIVDYNPHNISIEIKNILSSGQRSHGRSKALLYNNDIISEKIYNVYQKILS